ncbi:MAG: class I SAM-dependent methyltransferase [Phycisphaerae bacterium]|nr:class I SAM-dependent methyltransferase [Phycisphaerae bacterium]
MGKVELYLRDLFTGRLWHRAIRKYGRDRGAIFTSIYKSRYWNPNGSGESVSGEGSTLSITAKARSAIEAVVREFGITSMLDAPCGDFHWMKHTRLQGVKYTGADIVRPLIERNNREYGSAERRFIHLDIVEEVCEAVDLILCRDCIQHLTNAEALRVIQNFSKSGSKYLLMTMSPRLTHNDDMPKAGGFRGVTLFLPPFNLPKPEREFVEWVDENPNLEKTLGLWKLPIAFNG